MPGLTVFLITGGALWGRRCRCPRASGHKLGSVTSYQRRPRGRRSPHQACTAPHACRHESWRCARSVAGPWFLVTFGVAVCGPIVWPRWSRRLRCAGRSQLCDWLCARPAGRTSLPRLGTVVSACWRRAAVGDAIWAITVLSDLPTGHTPVGTRSTRSRVSVCLWCGATTCTSSNSAAPGPVRSRQLPRRE
jgi:hypothetical protein